VPQNLTDSKKIGGLDLFFKDPTQSLRRVGTRGVGLGVDPLRFEIVLRAGK
jgi:hypothetical protein